MRRTNYLQIFLIIIISALVGYYVGVNKISAEWNNYKPVLSIQGKEPPPSLSSLDFSNFWLAWEKIEKNYYDKSKLDPQAMLNGAINGMISSLEDPFTVYLPPVQNSNFKQGLAGQFQGIGAELGLRDKRVVVIAPLNGSPAQKAGVKAGDVILEVDGDSTENWTISQAVERIRGEKGTEVVLVLRQGDKDREVRIFRDVITVKSVEGYIRKAKDFDGVTVPGEKADRLIVYVSLSQFGDNTNQEWLSLMNKLSLEAKQNNARGFILDLRNNPGGYLSDANFVASEFLREGQVVVLEELSGDEKKTLRVQRRGLFQDIPMIVLINKGSASASEIVAGALRDHRRALLIGETSFGKGTIQQAEDFGNGAGLHITIARWLTPQGNWVNGSGLIPDIEVKVNSNDPSRDPQLEKAILELLQ